MVAIRSPPPFTQVWHPVDTMAAAHKKSGKFTEIERKFDVDEAAVTPSFDGLTSVAQVDALPVQTLDAVYYDTAGHDLARHRITLRRRTGGPDAGWHLKLPAGDGAPDARTEIRLQLDGAGGPFEVPADLRDIVLAVVRDRPLNPVARIATTRHVRMLYAADGSALAEFCDDEVTAGAFPDGGAETPVGSWREWELELAQGCGDVALLDRLGQRLHDAGATPAGHGWKLARVLDAATGPEPADASAPPPADPIHRAVAQQVAELITWDRAVRADAYDSVHQMRVTTRKLRSLLKESEESFGLTDDAWVLEELRQLAAILGVARDAEVLAEKYQKTLDELPADLIRGPVRERLVDGARRRYESGWRRSLAAMRTNRYFRLLDALEALVTAEPAAAEAHATVERAPVTIDAAYKRVRKAARTAAAAAATESPDRDEALHRIRKGAKRLRYTAAATGKNAVSDAAKTIQTLLGDHQDAVISRTHVAQQAAAAHAAGEDTFTYGMLYQLEDELAQSSRQQLSGALEALTKAVRKTH